MKGRKRALRITWREAWPIWLTFGLLFGFGIVGLWIALPSAAVPATALAPNEDATISLNELKQNMPRLFTYPLESGQRVEYFAELEAGGGVNVAFASCRRCFREGHIQQGGQILCGHCKEPMVKVTRGQTPPAEKDCTQIPIPFERSGDRLTIKADSVRVAFARWYGPLIAEDSGRATEPAK